MSSGADNSTHVAMVRYDRPFVLTKNVSEKATTDFVGKRPQTAGVSLSSGSEVRDLLNVILPPRCWVANGQLWKQMVSSMPATRQDVIRLQEALDKRLQEAEARETGICAVRRAIYAECFDEVIRQITINCSERGLLLVRIRDEMEVTLQAYESLYCSAVGYGMRKTLQSHIEKQALTDRVTIMEDARDSMEEVLENMKKKFERNQRRAAESFAIEEKGFIEEISYVKKTTAQIKLQLEGVIAPSK